MKCGSDGNAYYGLLKTWCDKLLEYQVSGTGNPRLDGGFLCPACMCIHGRSHDAVYPLLYLADVTGEERYLDAAGRLFDWGGNLVCDDGSLYNDAQSEWNAITVFTVIGLYESLTHHGHILKPEMKARMEERMAHGAAWIYRTFLGGFVTNINYHASAAAALAMAGHYEGKAGYRELAARLAQSCGEHILDEGCLYGEGKPMERITPRGCRPVDLGYNVEESVPSLLAYARLEKDEVLLEKLKGLLEKQLDFMLPDGGWDNSFGTRNFKWSYWGSRTSDGCHTAYATWGEEAPEFAEAARRNLELLASCTHDGLLYGGPDYRVHEEPPCLHHTFCHAKALAGVLDAWGWSGAEAGAREAGEAGETGACADGRNDIARTALPSECLAGVKHYPASDTWKIFHGGFIATVTAGDFEYMKGGHASGGTLTMLWHKSTGPLLLSSMTDYHLFEAHNMQLSRKKSSHQSLTPRLELEESGCRYASCYDYQAAVSVRETAEGICVETESWLRNQNQELPENPVSAHICILFADNRVRISGQLSGPGCEPGCERARLILPVLGQTQRGYRPQGEGAFLIPGREGYPGEVLVKAEGLRQPEAVFYLAGGFEAWKFVLAPDADGRFDIVMEIVG